MPLGYQSSGHSPGSAAPGPTQGEWLAAAGTVLEIGPEEFKVKDFPSDLKAQIDRSRVERMPEEAVWDLCSMFLEGKQWLEFDERMAHWRVRENFESARGLSHLTVNIILNAWRSILARLSLAAPAFGVLPASDSSEDRSRAKATELALRYWWHAAKLRRTIKKVLKYMASWGTGAFHVWFDPGPVQLKRLTTGTFDVSCGHCGWHIEDIELEGDASGVTCTQCNHPGVKIDPCSEWMEFYPKGMVRCEAVSSYNLFFEPGVRSWEESRWIAVRRYDTRRGLMEAFPASRMYIEEAESARPIAERMDGGRAPDERVEVFDVYWRDGRHAVIMGNVYLWQEVLPFENGLMPVRPVHYTEFPDRLWGYGIVEPQLDAQWEYNRTRSQVADNARLIGNPKWIVPRTAGLDQGAINDEPGEVIEYDLPGGKPEMVQAKPLPPYVLDHAMRLQQEAMDIIGLHSTSMGKRSVGVTAAKAMKQLEEFDVGQLFETMDMLQDALEDVGMVALKLMRHYYTEAMMFRMQDNTGAVIFGEISRTSLVEQPEVFIEADSLFKMQADQRDKRVMEMVELGVLAPEDAREELLFRPGLRWQEERMRGILHAREMLAEVIAGHQIEIFPSDDVDAFIDVFGEYMRTAWKGYLKLPVSTQEYIRNIHLDCIMANAPEEAYMMEQERRTIHPRVAPPPVPPEDPTAGMSEGEMGAMPGNIGIGGGETMTGGLDGEALVQRVRGPGMV
jgi:hypothetical protein